jgi:predicted DNA-binding transcriptional regulator AlpA
MAMGEAHAADTSDRLLRTQEVAARLAVSKSTLVRWRQSLEGPQVYWLADGVPRYRASDVERWLTGRSSARPRAPRRGFARAGSTR